MAGMQHKSASQLHHHAAAPSCTIMHLQHHGISSKGKCIYMY